jgi:lysophospholipase L1-like esterase
VLNVSNYTSNYGLTKPLLSDEADVELFGHNWDTIDSELHSVSEDLKVQKARMDTFTSLPSGSTSGNAELVDIRVDVDGNAHPNAGEAIRKQINAVGKTERKYPPNVQNGVYINSAGRNGIDEKWFTTLPIAIRAGETIVVHGKCPYYALYDENGAYIEGSYKQVFEVPTENPQETYKVTAETNCTIKVSGWYYDESDPLYQNPETVYVECENKVPHGIENNSIGYEHIKHGAIDKRHLGAKLIVKCNEIPLEQLYVMSDSNGEYSESFNSNYRSTGFIKVEPNCTYWINYEYPHTGYFYDEDKNPIKWIGSAVYQTSSFSHPVTDSIVRKELFTSPHNARYIRFNVKTEHLDTQCMGYGDLILTDEEITKSSADVYLDYLRVKSKSEWFGKKFVSLGTSITWQDGHPYASGEIANGYQSVIKEKLGFGSYLNKGASGRAMANTLNGTEGISKIGQTVDYTGYDLVLIEAGTNDFKLNVPLGSIGSIKDTVYNPSSFYGAYRSLLKHIFENYPDIQVVLLTPIQRSNSGYDTESTNVVGHKLIDYVSAIKAIGEMYSVPVCDLYANSGINALTLSRYTMDGLHPNDRGYVRMGECLSGVLKSIKG